MRSRVKESVIAAYRLFFLNCCRVNGPRPLLGVVVRTDGIWKLFGELRVL